MSRLRRFVLVLATCQFLLCCTGSAWAASKLELAVAIQIFPRVYKAAPVSVGNTAKGR